LTQKLFYYIRKLGFLIIVALFLAVYYFSSRHITHLRAIMYPRFFMIFLGAVVLWNMVDVIIKTAKELKKEETEKGFSLWGFMKEHAKEFILFFSALVFVILSTIIGFWVCTLIFIFSLSYYFGARKLIILIPQTVILVVLFYLLFEVFLKTGLPSGFLI